MKTFENLMKGECGNEVKKKERKEMKPSTETFIRITLFIQEAHYKNVQYVCLWLCMYNICYNFKICSFLQGLLSYLNGETGICYCTFWEMHFEFNSYAARFDKLTQLGSCSPDTSASIDKSVPLEMPIQRSAATQNLGKEGWGTVLRGGVWWWWW